MANVILANRTRRPPRMLILNLTKTAAPKKIETATVEMDKQGQARVRVQSKNIPGSLYLPVGVDVEVDEKILVCPEVVKAIKSKDVAVIKVAAQLPVESKPRKRRG